MIELKPFERADFQRLINWIDSEELLIQWAGGIFSYPLDEKQLENHLLSSIGEEPECLIFKAIDSMPGEIIGHIELCNINRRNKSATLARALIGPGNLRKRGIGTLMVKEALRIGFEELKLHRIEVNVYELNKYAISSYKKAKFQIEGILRDFIKVGDKYRNIYRMSVLENEWRENR
jgi:RimJ/RimL family protein N-acetyltransferase